MVPVPESDDEFAAFANEEVTTLQRGAGLQPRNLTRPERGEHARPSQTVLSGGGRWRVVVGVVLALIIAGAAGAYALGMFGSSAAVPSLVGDTVTQATTALQTAGLSLSVGTPENSATVPSGEIVSQSPKGGSSASSGSAVTVVVSAGPAMVNIPTSVIGESCAKATSKLRAAGFSVTCPASNAIASKAVKKGDVVEVLDGTTVNPASAPKGAALTLALSTGKAPVATTTTTVKNGKTVPSFVGLNESQVNALSASSGFYYHAESSAGVTMHGWTIVVSQSPKAGSVAAAGSTVTLIVR
jgi:serine/threonine-protein kinase